MSTIWLEKSSYIDGFPENSKFSWLHLSRFLIPVWFRTALIRFQLVCMIMSTTAIVSLQTRFYISIFPRGCHESALDPPCQQPGVSEPQTLKMIDRQTDVSNSSDWPNNRLPQSVYLCAVYRAQGCHRERSDISGRLFQWYLSGAFLNTVEQNPCVSLYCSWDFSAWVDMMSFQCIQLLNHVYWKLYTVNWEIQKFTVPVHRIFDLIRNRFCSLIALFICMRGLRFFNTR